MATLRCANPGEFDKLARSITMGNMGENGAGVTDWGNNITLNSKLYGDSNTLVGEFDFGWVTTGGAIVIQNTKFAMVVLQEPTLEQGKVTWSCIVHPTEAKPNLCGSDYQNELLQKK